MYAFPSTARAPHLDSYNIINIAPPHLVSQVGNAGQLMAHLVNDDIGNKLKLDVSISKPGAQNIDAGRDRSASMQTGVYVADADPT